MSGALGLHVDWVRQALEVGAISGKMWRLYVSVPPPVPAPAESPPVWVSATTDDFYLAHEITAALLELKERAGMSDEKLRAKMLMPDTRYFDRWRAGVSIATLASALQWALALGYTFALVPLPGREGER